MAHRHTYRIDLAYDGGAFAGFSRQPDRRTVEGQLLSAWCPLIPHLPSLRVGGRTDRGVHALRQTVSIWAREAVPLDELEARADEALGGDGWVLAVREVPRSFHARFSALARHYLYRLPEAERLDDEQVARLDAMLGALVGKRCLTAFARRTPPGTRTVRSILFAGARRELSGRVRVEVIAPGFIKRQVRVTVATALRELRAGSDAMALVRLAAIGDRRATERPAEADGLYLARILYPGEEDNTPLARALAALDD